MTVADFGFKPWPSAAALKAAGVTGVVQYVAGGSASKHITAAQYAALRAAGLDVALVWEQAARTLGTAFDAAGAARATKQAADALGYTGVIYWAADWNVTAADWPRVRDNMRAVCGVLGVARTGLYSSYDAIGWAQRDGVASHFWQSMSTAFSGGRNSKPHPAAHLWQRRQTTVGGADVDLNDVLKPNWGQQQEGIFMALSDARQQRMADIIEGLAWGKLTIDGTKDPICPSVWERDREKREAAMAAQMTALTAAVTKLATSGTSIDTQAVLAAIETAGQTESTAVQALQAQVADLTAKLAAAGQALDG